MKPTAHQLHLARLSLQNNIPKPHVNYLKKLNEDGFKPKTIYDIGSCVGNWANEAHNIWPEATIIMFDAYDKVEFLYKGKQYHIGVLSDEDNKVVHFHQNDEQPGGNSYYREIGHPISEKLFPERDFVEKVAMTLDTIVKQRNFPKPDFIKIDVQGAEKDIIKGAKETLETAQHLVVEMQKINYNKDAPVVDTTLPFIESFGFKCTAPLFCDNGPDGDYGFVRL